MIEKIKIYCSCCEGEIPMNIVYRFGYNSLGAVLRFCSEKCYNKYAERYKRIEFEKMKIEDESETQRRTREYDEARSGDEDL